MTRALLKWTGRLLAAVLVLVLIGAGVVYAASERKLRRTYDAAVDSVHVPTDAASIARGEHLVRNVIDCTLCHGDDLGGAVYSSSTAIGTVAGPNLTRGKGGIGPDYGDMDFVRAIRRGVRRDGRSLIVMPSEVFTHLSQEDLAAVIAFLRQVPPVDREVPRSGFGPVGRALLAAGKMNILVAGKTPHLTPPVSVPPDTTAAYGKYIADIAGSPSPVEVKIFGEDMPTLINLADRVNRILEKTPGVVDNKSGVVMSSPETTVNVDTERAQRYGLSADDIRQNAEAAVQGVEPTSIQEGEQSVGIRVQARRPSGQLDAHTLGDIPIASPVTNGTVPLSSLAAITPMPGSPAITRDNQRQMVTVTAGLNGRDLGSATHDIQQQIREDIHLPAGYSIEYGGLYESQQRSFADLAAVLLTAFGLVFILLIIQLRSFGQAVALILAAVLSLVGVLLGLSITRTPLNISSMTGAVMIVGIVTENGIVLFEFLNSLMKRTPTASTQAMMLEAGSKRLRPILMTTIGAILALMPLALGIGAGAALQKPLAIAVIGGLTVSTLFTLIVAPVLFVATERFRKPGNVGMHEEGVDRDEIATRAE